jgi:ParB family chromosome partitioning protein
MSRFDALNENDEIMYEEANCFEIYPNEKIRMKLHDGEKREQLKESIIKNGILTPVIAMPSDKRGVLTIIAGANRVDIAKELNIKVPYQLKTDLTQEQADLICIDTNLLNRQHDEYLPSELAYILKTKWEILNKQGKRTDLEEETSRTLCTKSNIENEYKMSKRNIQYYIRLTYLNKNLLQMVDDNKIPFRSGVEISFLKAKEQIQLQELIQQGYNVSVKIAEELKKQSQESDDVIKVKSIIDELMGNTNSTEKIKFNKSTKDKIKKIIPEDQIGNFNEIIIEALELYYYKNKEAIV